MYRHAFLQFPYPSPRLTGVLDGIRSAAYPCIISLYHINHGIC